MSFTRRKLLQGSAGAVVTATLGSRLGADSALAAHGGRPEARSCAALLGAFEAPPQPWRPRGWWHWMSPNITPEGILEDLDWMQRVGLGGFHQFTGNGGNPYVPSPIAYMSTEFKNAWKLAVEGAAARGLEAVVTSSAGWSITGAPFVAAEDGIKKHVWTETWVEGGAPVSVALPPPPTASGSFLDKPTADVPTYYKDQAVFAYRVDDDVASQAALSPDVYLSGYRDSATGAPVTNGETGVLLSSENAAALLDDSIVDPRFLSPLNGSSWIRFEFDTPVALRGFARAERWRVRHPRGNGYCPSHQHLADAELRAAAGPFQASAVSELRSSREPRFW